MQRVVLDVDEAVLGEHVRLGLALVRRTGDGRLDDAFATVCLDDNAVLGQLLLHENDLFCALDDKVATGIEGALVHACEGRIVLSSQPALVAAKHDRQASDRHILTAHNFATACVLDVDVDKGAVGNVAQTAFVRRDAAVDRIWIGPFWAAHGDVRVLEVEFGIDI